ncbi:MAG: hypothetical protein HQ581_09790 [Planctomycetes bacterium]|nr:hypothetical protein [Planctomycetota bacterium]
MWRCSNCDESIEDTFDNCWNCGAASDGTVDFDFQREPDDPEVPDPGEDADLDPDSSESDATRASGSDAGMNRREVAELVCKTLALVMFALAAIFSIAGVVLILFAFIVAPLRGWFDGDNLYVSLILSIPMFATLIVGLVYWKGSKSIASRMVSADPAPVTIQSVTVQDAMMVTFSTVGVFVLIDGVRDLAAFVFVANTNDFTTSEFWYASQTWSTLLYLALALWLMLGSRGIVRAIHWLRTAGVPEPGDGREDENAA